MDNKENTTSIENKAMVYSGNDVNKLFSAIIKHVPYLEAEILANILRKPLQVVDLMPAVAPLVKPSGDLTNAQPQAPQQAQTPALTQTQG